MSDGDDKPRRDIEFEQLNVLGKAVFLTGAAVRTTSQLLDYALHRAADIVAESERAFRQGLDPDVQDAKIVEEREGSGSESPSSDDETTSTMR